jgi:para-nitrobenzyl esterase
MRSFIFAAALVASFAITSAGAQTPPAHYSTSETDIGTLLDDPAASAVLDKYAPGFTSDGQVQMARPMTLKAIQQYAPERFSDEVLAKIDADLAKLPAKK